MKTTYKDHTITITVLHDEDMGPPWEENDGHGPVSDWTRRGKYPGERVLSYDKGSSLFYDFAEAVKIAKRDGWGLMPEHKQELTTKLGRVPTPMEIVVASVERDFDYLRGWCNNEWNWLGYTTEIEEPSGQTHIGGSYWGFDDERYMLDQAIKQAEATVEWLITTREQTQIAACVL